MERAASGSIRRGARGTAVAALRPGTVPPTAPWHGAR
jgi:hypothetical protein